MTERQGIMSIKIFEVPAENKAYLEGYLTGKKADWHDWVAAELKAQDAEEREKKAYQEMLMLRDAALAKIARLEDQILHERLEHEREKDELMSQIRAYQVAFRQQEREMEMGVELASRKRRRL